jgi:phage recombination protein Bet
MKQELTQVHDLDALRSRIEPIRKLIAPDLDDQELIFFLEYCRKTGLDPVTRQIYASKRRSKNARGEWESRVTVQTSIDGQRLIAQRTGEYQGQLGPYWCGKDGAWSDVWLRGDNPAAARVGVLRVGFKEPVWAVALFKSYAQLKQDGSLTSMWAKMPELMIGKCAEALALRKAFPNELSGLYSDDEMAQADSYDQVPKPALQPSGQGSTSLPEPKVQTVGVSSGVPPSSLPVSAPPSGSPNSRYPTDADIADLQDFVIRHDWKNSEVISLIQSKFNKHTPRACTLEELDVIVDLMKKNRPEDLLDSPPPPEAWFPREEDYPAPPIGGHS